MDYGLTVLVFMVGGGGEGIAALTVNKLWLGVCMRGETLTNEYHERQPTI